MSTVAIFGAAAFWEISQADTDRVMEMVIEAGINHIDVAPSYGQAEERIGPWMSRERGRFFLGCKTTERTKEGAWKEMHESLRRLQTKTFDLYQLHAVTSMEELDKVTMKSGAWTRVAANKRGWMPSSWLRAVKDLPRSLEERRAAILEDSARMTGVPYLWGGMSGNGIDCSGLARLLHKWIGIEIPRDADMQHSAARPVEPPFEIGDLFFFGEGAENRHVTHVGISLGGWTMIHSSRRQNGVYIDNIQEVESLREIHISAGSFLG